MPSGTFKYTIGYNNVPLNISSTDYIPIIDTSGSFTQVDSSFVFVDASSVNVSIDFSYVNINGSDGLSFYKPDNSKVNWYSANTTSFTITQFDGIPLSKSGSQFYTIQGTNNCRLIFSASDSPTIVQNTSLQECFLNRANFNYPIGHWNTSNVTNMVSMFEDAGNFNQDISGWDTRNVTDMLFMFLYAQRFNSPIGNWNISNVTRMEGMFQSANSFNQDISGWNTTAVTAMYAMFYGATNFNNGDVSGGKNKHMNWNVAQVENLSGNPPEPQYFRTSSGLTLENSPFYTAPVICFKEDSTILCFVDGKETYIPIQNIRKGTLVKTCLNGYVPVNMIGTSKLYNPSNNLRGKNRLYKCTKEKYPELTEDLIITGCHSILVDHMTDEQRAKSVELTGDIWVTDRKYRLIACTDERADPLEEDGLFNIWHLALDNDDIRMNYGIYANGGLLVETTSIRMLREYSGMTLL